MRARGPRSLPSRSAVVATVAVLIAPPAAAFAVWGDGSNPVYDARPVTVPDPQPRRPYQVVPPVPIVSFPGTVTLDEHGIPELFAYTGHLTDAEFAIVDAAGAARAHAVTTLDHGLHRAIWRYTMADGVDPARLRDGFDGYFRRNAWQVRRPGAGEVAIWRAPDQGGLTSIIAHYIRGRDVIRVETRGNDEAAVARAFAALLTAQRTAFPPEGWSSDGD